MSIRFDLKIELGNAAAKDGRDVATILHRVAKAIDERGTTAPIVVRDTNGNTIGAAMFSEGASA